MSLDERLLLEFQSIGLYPKILPDLAEEDEGKNQDIMVLKEELCQQIGWKNDLDKIDRAIQKGSDTRRKIVQAVFDQLIETAHIKILACRGSKKDAGLKVSKQVALGFVKRALGSCKIYNGTGNSCFSESDLRHMIYSTPLCENVAKSVDCNASGTTKNTSNKASNLEKASKAGAGSRVSERYDSHVNNADKGLPDSPQRSIHLLSEQVSSRSRPLFMKEKKRKILVIGVGDGASPRASNLGGLVNVGIKGKRSRRDKYRNRDQSGPNSIARAGWQSLNSHQSKCETNAKPKQKCDSWGRQDTFLEAKESTALAIPGSSQSVDNAGNYGRDVATLCCS